MLAGVFIVDSRQLRVNLSRAGRRRQKFPAPGELFTGEITVRGARLRTTAVL